MPQPEIAARSWSRSQENGRKPTSVTGSGPFSRTTLVASGIGVLVLAGFLWDLSTSLGYVPWLLYLPALLLTLLLPGRWAAPGLAGICTALLWLGFLHSSTKVNAAIPAALFNRSLGTAILWLIVGGCLLYKQADTVLRKKDAHLTAAQALAHVGSWEWAIATGTNIWSDEQYRIFGYTPQAVPATYDLFINAVLPEDRPHVLAALDSAVAGNTPYEIECRITHPNGEVRSVECRGALHLDENGRPARMSGTVLDITDRKQAEDALRENEERWHLVLQGSNDGIWDWNIRAGTVFYSPRWKAMRGFEDHEITTSIDEWKTRIHPDDFTRVMENLASYFAKRKPFFAEEYRVRCKHGTYIWILDRCLAQWDETGTPVRMAGSETDITERKRVEEHLIQSQAELHALMAHLESVRETERTKLARELHDELGQALTALKMDVAWLVKGLEAMPASGETARLLDKTRDMQDLIDASVQGIRRLVLELRPPALDHLGLVDAMKWLAQDFQKRHGLGCTFHCPTPRLAIETAATTALFRIAQEALTNVARHAQATRVTVQLEQTRGEVCLTVTDNGLGLTDGTAASPTSFGLIGIKERARLLGGTAAFRGWPGQGTQVSVRIPREPAA